MTSACRQQCFFFFSALRTFRKASFSWIGNYFPPDDHCRFSACTLFGHNHINKVNLHGGINWNIGLIWCPVPPMTKLKWCSPLDGRQLSAFNSLYTILCKYRKKKQNKTKQTEKKRRQARKETSITSCTKFREHHPLNSVIKLALLNDRILH